MPEPRQAYVVDEAAIAIGGTWSHQYDFKPDQICIVLHTAPAYGLRLRMTGTKGGAAIPLLSQGPFIVPGVTENQQITIDSDEAVAITATVVAQVGYAPTSLNAPAITKASVVPGLYQTLVDGAVIDWDINAGSAQVTIAGNRAMSNPTNGAAGYMYFLLVYQDAIGNRTLTWGTNYRFEGGVPPLLSFAPNVCDMLEFMCDGTYFHCQRITRNVSDAFSPLSVPQCKVWLAGHAIVGLADGDAVGTWPDSSGNAYDFAQGVAANRPIYKTAIINGYPVVRFDGVNDYIDNAVYSAPIGASFFAVAQTLGGAATIRFVFHSRTAVTTGYLANIATWDMQDGAAAGIVGTAVVNGVPKLGVRVQAVGYTGYWLNGASQGALATAGACLTQRIGASNVPGQYFNGDIAELIIYSATLTAAQRQSVEQYLRAKYALW